MKNELSNLLKNKYSLTDLSTIVVEYVKKEKGIEVTGEQLSLIISMLNSNSVFISNMVDKIMNDITSYNLTYSILYDKKGDVIKIDINDL